MSIEETFRRLVRDHDLTFEYSDCVDIWENGYQSRCRIRKLANFLPRKTAAAIWDRMVDTKIGPDFPDTRRQFYWKNKE